MQGVQEQDANIAGAATVRRQVVIPGAHVHEYRPQVNGDLSFKI